MSKTSKHHILKQDPADLDVIPELIAFMQQHGFENLSALLKLSVPQMLHMEGFDYRCLRSMYVLLEKNGHDDLLRDFALRNVH